MKFFVRKVIAPIPYKLELETEKYVLWISNKITQIIVKKSHTLNFRELKIDIVNGKKCPRQY